MDNITDYIEECKAHYQRLEAERVEAERLRKEDEAVRKEAEAAQRKARRDEVLAPYPEAVRNCVVSINGNQVEVVMPNVTRFWAVHMGINASDKRFQFVDESDREYATTNIEELIGMLAE